MPRTTGTAGRSVVPPPMICDTIVSRVDRAVPMPLCASSITTTKPLGRSRMVFAMVSHSDQVREFVPLLDRFPGDVELLDVEEVNPASVEEFLIELSLDRP